MSAIAITQLVLAFAWGTFFPKSITIFAFYERNTICLNAELRNSHDVLRVIGIWPMAMINAHNFFSIHRHRLWL